MEISKRNSPLRNVFLAVSDYTKRYCANSGPEDTASVIKFLNRWRLHAIDKKAISTIFDDLRKESSMKIYDYVMGGTQYMQFCCTDEEIDKARVHLAKSIEWMTKDPFIDEDVKERVAQGAALDELSESAWVIFFFVAVSLAVNEITAVTPPTGVKP